MTGDASAAVHATAVVIDEGGILIEGRSGSGKSSLALALLDDARTRGRFGRLVGDDRVLLTARHGRLVARPHPAVAGLVERRGLGLLREPHEPACVVRLVVALVGRAGLAERYPDAVPSRELLGVKVRMLILPAVAGARENSQRVFMSLILRQDGA